MKPKLNQPNVEKLTSQELQNLIDEYCLTPQNIREILVVGQMFRNSTTIEEVKKEWEDDGWSFIGTKAIVISKYVGGSVFSTTDIQLDLEEKDCFIRGILNCRELQRLIKTIKTLKCEV